MLLSVTDYRLLRLIPHHCWPLAIAVRIFSNMSHHCRIATAGHCVSFHCRCRLLAWHITAPSAINTAMVTPLVITPLPPYGWHYTHYYCYITPLAILKMPLLVNITPLMFCYGQLRRWRRWLILPLAAIIGITIIITPCCCCWRWRLRRHYWRHYHYLILVIDYIITPLMVYVTPLCHC